MKMKKVTPIEMLDMIEDVAGATENILLLDVYKRVNIVSRYTDMDLSEYMEDGLIDFTSAYNMIYDEAVIEKMVLQHDFKSKLDEIDKLLILRYDEINSISNKIARLINMIPTVEEAEKIVNGIDEIKKDITH